ncbi:transposase [Vibrio parahaemolyticus]|nr:transposase [Vibrio parahaemolyticus]
MQPLEDLRGLYDSMEELQKDLNEWMDYYNNHRTH